VANDDRSSDRTARETVANPNIADSAAVTTLAGGLAHELNNILGIILGNAELASMEAELSASARTSLEEIEKAGRHGLRVVQQILALGRSRPLPADAAGWKAVVDDAARILRASLPEGMDLELSVTGKAPAAAAAASATTAPGRAASSGRRILYLDDEESMVNLASRMLRRLGYDVTGFVQPEKALSALKEDPSAFDLVVTDYNMPRITGLEVARQATALRADLPVMVTTGHITDEMRASAAGAGVRHLIEKPDSMDELCRAVGEALAAAGS